MLREVDIGIFESIRKERDRAKQVAWRLAYAIKTGAFIPENILQEALEYATSTNVEEEQSNASKSGKE